MTIKDVQGSALFELASAFGLKFEDLRKLEAFENAVYEGERGGEACILRVSHISHREPSDVRAEFHWVHYLRRSGMAISGPLLSLSGDMVAVSSDGNYTAVLIEKMPGVQMSTLPASRWTSELFEEWGRTIGWMHRLSSEYATGADVRFTWDQDRYVLDFSKFVSGQDPVFMQNWQKILEDMSEIPRSAQNFGLIHDDLHTKNFCFHEGRLQVFDTDDCKQHWLLADVASILYSVELSSWRKEHPISDFLIPFWQGYRREFEVCPEIFRYLPLFLRFRAALVLGALCHKWDIDNLQDKQSALFRTLAKSLKNETPLVDLTPKEWRETLL